MLQYLEQIKVNNPNIYRTLFKNKPIICLGDSDIDKLLSKTQTQNTKHSYSCLLDTLDKLFDTNNRYYETFNHLLSCYCLGDMEIDELENFEALLDIE